MNQMMENLNLTETEQSIHLGEYYHIIMRHKWTIIISLIIVVSLTLLHNSRLIPIYRATSTLIIDKKESKSRLTGKRDSYESYISESLSFNTHLKLITSRPVLELAIKGMKFDQMSTGQKKAGFAPISAFWQLYYQLKKNLRLLLDHSKGTSAPQDKITGLVRWLRGMINIQPIEDTRLLKILVFSASPKIAMDTANAMANAYIDFNMNNRLKSSRNTLSWLSDNLYEMKKKLEDAEQEFLTYKQQAKLISLEESKKVIAQKVTEFNDAYIRARNRRLELDTKLDQLNKVTKSDGNIPHLRSLIENKQINDLSTQLVNAEVELSRLSKVFKSKHPKVIQVRTSIEKTRSKLNTEIRKELDNLKAERTVLISKEKVLQNTMSDFEKEGLETNKKELKFTIFKRNVQMNQQLYDTLLSRIKETDITGNIDVSNIRITEKAILPGRPVRPNKTRNLMLGAIFGLMLGVGLIFFREYLDRTLRTDEDVQKYLGLPVLSIIPLAEESRDRSSYSKESEADNEQQSNDTPGY